MKVWWWVSLFAMFVGAAWGCGSTTEDKDDPPVVIIRGDAGNNGDVNNSSGTANGTSNGSTNAATNNGSEPAAMTVEEFLEESRRIYCTAPTECPNAATAGIIAAVSRYATLEECMASRDVLYADRTYHIAARVEDGAIAFDGSTAAECLEQMHASLCEGRWARATGDMPACDGVLVGQQDEGEECVGSYDCVDDAYCDTSRTCGSRVCTRTSGEVPCGTDACNVSTEYCDLGAETCRPRKGESETCDFGQCESGLFCTAAQGGECQGWASQGAGESCVVDYSCELSLVCREKTCVELTFGAAGAPCGVWSAQSCEPGLVCRLGPTEDEGVCGAPLTQGEPCRSTYSCAGHLMCDVWAGSTCQPYYPDGAVCQSPLQCDSGSCPGGMGSAADGTCSAACML